MNIKKILFVDEGVLGPTQLGGGQLVILNLMEKLDKLTFHPILLTSKDGELASEARKRGIDVIIGDVISRNFVRRDRSKLSMNPLSLIFLLLHLLFASIRLTKIVKKVNPSLIFPNENLSRSIVLFSKLFHRIPTFAYIDGEWDKGFFDFLMRSWFVRGFDKLIAVSNAVANIAGRNAKIEVLNVGLETKHYRKASKEEYLFREELGISKESILIVTVGKLIKFKGQYLMLDVVSRLKKAHDDFFYVLIGDGPDKDWLTRICEQLAIEDRVLFLGQRSDVPKILSEMDIMVHPSFTEAFPLAVIEGCLSSLYVIASDVGGVAEILKSPEVGVKIPANDIESLYKAVEESLKMPEAIRKQIGKAARKSAESKLSIDSWISRMESAILESI